MIGKRVQKAAIASVLAAVIGLSLGASADTPGVKMEVREGDLWTGVTVLRKEGPKTLIRYEDKAEEWVSNDRLRGVSGPPGTASTTRPAAAAESWLTVGSKVERKSLFRWNPGKITESERGWYLVKDQKTPWSYWCEPWLLRAPGSAYDIKLSHQDVHRGLITPVIKEQEPAPADPPGPSRRRIGSAPQYVPGPPKVEMREGDQWIRVTVLRKEGSETLIRYDDDAEEWVSNDRLRKISGNPGSASTTQPAAEAKSWLTVGYYVEYRGDTAWYLGKIIDSQRGWYLIGHDWYEPWMLRAPGSAYGIEYGNRAYHHRMWVPMPGPAPADPPGPSPRRFGNAPQDVPGALPAPPATRLDLGAAADPQPGTMTPLNLATTRPTKGFRSATIGGREGASVPRAQSVALCRDTPGVVVFGHRWIWGSDGLDVIRFDINTGRTIGLYPLSIRSQYIAGAANSGKVLLTRGGSGLCLWELQGHTYKITAEYVIDLLAYQQIEFACLTDATHVVVRDSGGNCFYIDLKENRAIGKIQTSLATRIYVDPTGQVLAAITWDGRTMTSAKAVLIRLSDFSTIAEFPGAAHKGSVAIDAAGELIAFYCADGPVRVIRLADGSVVGNIQVTLQFPGELDLPGEGFLLVDHRYVFDIQTGIPVWIYNDPPEPPGTVQRQPQYAEWPFRSERAIDGAAGSKLMIQLPNGQTLFCSPGKDSSDIVMATLPDARARNALKGVDRKTFMLTPGTPVNFARSGVGGDADSTKIVDAVRNAIKAAGLVLSKKQEDFRVTLSIRSGNTQQRNYSIDTRSPYGRELRSPFPWGMQREDPVTLNVPTTVVTVVMTYKNEPVWSQQFTSKPDEGIPMNPGQTPQEAMNEASRRINVGGLGLGFLVIPAYLQTGFTPGTTPALGASDVTPQGLVPTVIPPTWRVDQ